ncbi:MAG: hypothetical protein IT557_17465 [Alphaproteobacteria bacterium]|nr:hypothetical protein [Alphaproteobacteria bacterium]
MPDFRFDENKVFLENCRAALEALEADDPEMAAILRGNWEALLAIVGEGERDPKARVAFNTNVAAALDALAQSAPKGGS